MTTDPIQLLRTARAAIQKQDYTTAVQAMQSLVQHDQATHNTTLEILHRSNLAMLQNRLGHPDDALQHLNHALELARHTQDRASEEGVLGNIGVILQETDQPEAAITYLEQALAIAKSIGDHRGRGNWFGALGLAYDDLTRYGEAVRCHRQAVEIARQLDDQTGLAQRLGQLGNTRMRTGHFRDALNHYEEAIEIYRRLGNRAALALRLGIVGNIYAELGRAASFRPDKEAFLVQALANYRETLHIARDLDDKPSQGALLREMGQVYAEMGNNPEAIAHFTEAIAIFQSLGQDTPLPDLQKSIALAKQYRDNASE
jgi:tetratricopeptide (TPR) repeat protein